MPTVAAHPPYSIQTPLMLAHAATVSRHPAGRLNIVLVTAEPLLRSALCWALRQIRPDGDIIKVSRLSEARKAVLCEDCALVLLDEESIDGADLDAIRAFTAEVAVPIAILSSDTDAATVSGSDGVLGYVDRSSALEDMATTVCGLVAPLTSGAAAHKETPDSATLQPENALTPAQLKVLALVEKGQLNKQIAYELGIAESTVKAHVSAVLRKLNVQNRVQATLVAHRQLLRTAASRVERGA